MGIATYSPLVGSSYVKLPQKLEDKKAILNVQNQDERCFVWSVLASLQPVHCKDQTRRVQHYKKYAQELNLSGIEFPMKVHQIPQFERQNPNISVNVFGYEEKELFPVYIRKEKKKIM